MILTFLVVLLRPPYNTRVWPGSNEGATLLLLISDYDVDRGSMLTLQCAQNTMYTPPYEYPPLPLPLPLPLENITRQARNA